ncbi:MAG: dUTP diphosphatase [bacterium]|jgi:dUTP pyrophosphatase
METTLVVKVKRLAHAKDLPMPQYMTAGASGYDLFAALETKAELLPMQRVLIPTGLVMAIPAGYEGQVRPRSGLALKHGVTVLNSPGTIDADYRGEIKVLLINLGEEPFIVRRGDRIAQLVIQPVVKTVLQMETELEDTVRGAGGFGHTGR